MSGGMSDALYRAVAHAIDDTEHERFGVKLEAIMAVIEKHTERVTVTAMAIGAPVKADAAIVVESQDDGVLMNRYQRGQMSQVVELTMLRGSGNWGGQ